MSHQFYLELIKIKTLTLKDSELFEAINALGIIYCDFKYLCPKCFNNDYITEVHLIQDQQGEPICPKCGEIAS